MDTGGSLPGRKVKLTTHLHPVTGSNMRVTLPPRSSMLSSRCAEDQVQLYLRNVKGKR